MNELPTPYDILPPPKFPFVLPGYFVYTLIALLVAGFGIWLFLRRTKNSNFKSKERQLKDAISAFLLKSSPSRAEVNQLRIQLQLYLSYSRAGDRTMSLSEQDLVTLSEGSSDPVVQTICALLTKIQSARYAPTWSGAEISQLLATLVRELP